ncbi:MAG: iron-sulfur cluster repair di-iron protein [Nitrospina sp.]|jgi:regulator of cell morphogenesis and NO signaling|nr:iron-sulfur cluster repair di-iron protein [Nitrospina sp.]
MKTQWGIQTSVAEFVKNNVLCAETFEELSIDFCCGGESTLEKACQEKGLEPKQVLGRLMQLQSPSQDSDVDLEVLNPGELTLHIESKHHEYLKKVFPRISDLLEKVLAAHGERHPELKSVQKAYSHLREDLEPHLMKEERVLFPLIRQLESQGLGTDMTATEGPVRVMLMEHDSAGELLKQIRDLTENFKTPEDGCQSFNLLYEELRLLELDTHLHIHKENNILFKKLMPSN